MEGKLDFQMDEVEQSPSGRLSKNRQIKVLLFNEWF